MTERDDKVIDVEMTLEEVSLDVQRSNYNSYTKSKKLSSQP